MAEMEQVQKAGIGSTQLQAGVVNVTVGIDEKRVREIFDEKFKEIIDKLSLEARDVAIKQANSLLNSFVDRISTAKLNLDLMSTPRYQRELSKAQYSAAMSTNEADIGMLTELLVARMNGGIKRNTETAISRAIEIVPDIDDDELLALTVVHAVNSYIPGMAYAPDLHSGLNSLNNLFERIVKSHLPEGSGWLENLDMLDAVTMRPVKRFRKFDELYAYAMPGYVCAGIKQDDKATETLRLEMSSVGLPEGMLVKNELCDGYLRMPVVGESGLDKLVIVGTKNGITTERHFNAKQKEICHKAWQMYNRDEKLIGQVRQRFVQELNNYGSLAKVRTWWDELEDAFTLTQVGRALAYVNARRCAPNLPVLELEDC